MPNEKREVVNVNRDGNFVNKERVVEYQPSTQDLVVSRLTQFVWVVTSIIALLLSGRFILQLMAANGANPFADFIYDATNFLVAPFQTLIANPAVGNGVFSVTTIIAIGVYLVLAIIIGMILALFRDGGGSRRVTQVQQS